MKNLTILFGLLMCLSAISCEKCATCTTVSEDPLTLGDPMTQKVCARGRNYKDQISIYEKSDWTCTAE